MRERRNIKIRVDMFEDTKLKIIDSMEARDTIYYIWIRILALCGKNNNEEGYLFVSKDMPYTIEILSLEFNRSEAQIKNAIDVFIKLNMMSKDNDSNAYKVCNWGKHQGIRKNKKENTEEVKKEENTKVDTIETNKIDENLINDKSNIDDAKQSDEIKNKDTLNGEIICFKESVNDITDVKHNKKKKRKSKKKIEEILVFDEDECEETFYDTVPINEDDKVINSFNFT